MRTISLTLIIAILICITVALTQMPTGSSISTPAVTDRLLAHAVLTPRDARPWMRLADRRLGQPNWIAGGH